MSKSEKQRMWLEKMHKQNIGRVPWNKGIKVWWKSPTIFKKNDPRIIGKNNYFWRGGVTPINEKIRKSIEYKQWRKAVFQRDNYKCVDCGAKNGDGKRITLNADHIKPFAYFPELRFTIDNGRTLCIICHRKTFINLKQYQHGL